MACHNIGAAFNIHAYIEYGLGFFALFLFSLTWDDMRRNV